MTDRLFLDANVLFSAAYRTDSGLSQLWTIPKITLLTSAYAVEEAMRNLEDDDQRSRLRHLLSTVELVVSLSQESGMAKFAPTPQQADLPEKDRPILQVAITGRASHLITGDFKHFGRFFGQTIAGLQIMPPAEYLKSNKRRR
ncbi:MAG: PIN domain-containing protein [Acidobacteriota bacterium]